MPKRRLFIVLFLLAPLCHADAGHYVLFRAQPAVAEISVSETQEKVMPTLEFPFRLDAACAGPAQGARLSLNVADVRKSWTTDEGAITIEDLLVVPAEQTAPVMADFCIAGDYGVKQLVRSVLTAQIALTCSTEDSRTIGYQSMPLDIELACPQPPEEESLESSDSPPAPDEATSS